MDKQNKISSGLSFFGIVLIFGLILAFWGASIGIGASARIPFTQSNLSIGGSLGKKETVRAALPVYLSNRIADNNNFYNQTGTLTIWLAEGIGMIVLGNQPEAPIIDLNLKFIQ